MLHTDTPGVIRAWGKDRSAQDADRRYPAQTARFPDRATVSPRPIAIQIDGSIGFMAEFKCVSPLLVPLLAPLLVPLVQ